jgi:hypothetical protein
MRALTRIALAAALICVSCSDGSGVQPPGAAPTAAPTTSGQTESPEPPDAMNGSPSTTPSGSRDPCPYGSDASGGYLPTLRLSPDPSAVGETVTVHGEHFSGKCWPYGPGRWDLYLFLASGRAPPGCELVAELGDVARVAKDGRVGGQFIVPRAGLCRMDLHNPPRQPRVVPGRYRVTMGCPACSVGTFTVAAP